MTDRLRGDQRAEMEAHVLAYLRDSGPRPMSEIHFALNPLMTAHFVYRTVKELVEAGKITARNVELSSVVRHERRSQVVPYRATVYEIVKSRSRRRKGSSA